MAKSDAPQNKLLYNAFSYLSNLTFPYLKITQYRVRVEVKSSPKITQR